VRAVGGAAEIVVAGGRYCALKFGVHDALLSVESTLARMN
jgi:hypothetical protein